MYKGKHLPAREKEGWSMGFLEIVFLSLLAMALIILILEYLNLED